jgi:transcriptional regulator with XRE-family HTH domain
MMKGEFLMDITIASRPNPSNGSSAAGQFRQHPLHRLSSARRAEGLSCRAVARRLQVDVAAIKRQEQPGSDLLLSELYQWQEALGVPIAELVVESDGLLSTLVRRRAQLVRVMKTALAIQEASTEEPIRRMAAMLIDQLSAIMPQLRNGQAWHTIGIRRSRNEFGAAAERQVPADTLFHPRRVA